MCSWVEIIRGVTIYEFPSMVRKSMCLCALSPDDISAVAISLVQYKIVVIFEIPPAQFFVNHSEPLFLCIAGSFPVRSFPPLFCTAIWLHKFRAWTLMQGLSLNASTHPPHPNLSQ